MRLASIVIVGVIIGGWASARADTSSQIEPKKIGADSLVNQTLKCRDAAKAAQPDAKPALLLGYCFCVVDYVRKQSGDSNVKFWSVLEKMDSTKTTDVISACNEWAVAHQDDKAPVDSPYSSKLDVSTQQLFGATQGCQRNVKDMNMTTMQRVGMCACVADSMRTMTRKKLDQLVQKSRAGGETASSFPQDKLEFCSQKWDVE